MHISAKRVLPAPVTTAAIPFRSCASHSAIARRCQDAGAAWITLHPRTRADMYSGQARWSEIRALVEALGIPVIGNGDIRTGADAARMRDETGSGRGTADAFAVAARWAAAFASSQFSTCM